MKYIGILAAVLIILTSCLFTACGTPESPFEDTYWILTSYKIDGQSRTPLQDTGVTAFFERETKEVRGNASCNTYFGIYKFSGDELEIMEPFAVTEMWCGDEKGLQEREYLDVLQSAGNFSVKNDTLSITGSKGILNFKRASVQ